MREKVSSSHWEESVVTVCSTRRRTRELKEILCRFAYSLPRLRISLSIERVMFRYSHLLSYHNMCTQSLVKI